MTYDYCISWKRYDPHTRTTTTYTAIDGMTVFIVYKDLIPARAFNYATSTPNDPINNLKVIVKPGTKAPTSVKIHTSQRLQDEYFHGKQAHAFMLIEEGSSFQTEVDNLYLSMKY